MHLGLEGYKESPDYALGERIDGIIQTLTTFKI